jgi:hypothetical protein
VPALSTEWRWRPSTTLIHVFIGTVQYREYLTKLESSSSSPVDGNIDDSSTSIDGSGPIHVVIVCSNHIPMEPPKHPSRYHSWQTKIFIASADCAVRGKRKARRNHSRPIFRGCEVAARFQKLGGSNRKGFHGTRNNKQDSVRRSRGHCGQRKRSARMLATHLRSEGPPASIDLISTFLASSGERIK